MEKGTLLATIDVGMKLSSGKLKQSLLELDIATPEILEDLYKRSLNNNIDFVKTLVGENVISEDNLGKIIADNLSVPFVKLSQQVISPEVLNVIPEVVAKKNNIVAFKKDKFGLHLATSSYDNDQIVSFVEKKVGIPVVIYYAGENDVKDALNNYEKDIKTAYHTILDDSVNSASKKTKDDLSIIKIVETTISYAYKNKASDIHIEPYEDKSLIRFRIDGILHDIMELPKDVHNQVVTRVKVLAKLRTDEHQAPQDGKISFKTESENIDIRVSIVPTTHGEKIVMRLLSEKSRQYSLSDLGFSEKDLEKLTSAYKKPHGMILSTGPTGSGKTTTLYAILKILNRREVNIMTIEDPVEYEIEGISQIQVNEKTGLTFANGLRSLVRQDPDIMLVGEIRDEETAGISVNAAMTGHLVLSTLHTNDAATSIPRLLDLGVEPFLVSSTVNVIIGQRLVRRICAKCRISEEFDNESVGADGDSQHGNNLKLILKDQFKNGKLRVYKGKGCDICHQTGYLGRVGIFEVLLVGEEIKQAIVDKKDASVIQSIAVKNGMTTMFQDGIKKMLQGVTTLDEILRVTKE